MSLTDWAVVWVGVLYFGTVVVLGAELLWQRYVGPIG